MVASSLSKIFRSAASLREAMRISGVTGSARAWFLLRLQEHIGKTLLVLCPDDDSASELLTDVEALRPLVAGASADGLVFPIWEHSLYSSISPSIRIRQQRASTLGQLAAADGSPRMIFTSPAALASRLPPPAAIAGATVRLCVGSRSLSREALVRSIVDAGYFRVESVEDPGTVALRGEILDVHPVGSETPYRVEFFDDEVERIRPFDPGTQRTAATTQSVMELTVFPAREVMITASSVPKIRESLKRYADDLGVSRALRDPVLSSLIPGAYPERSEAWGPFWHDGQARSMGSLADYLPADSCWVVWDDLGCDQSWDEFWQKERQAHSRIKEQPDLASSILPPPELRFDVAGHSSWSSRFKYRLQKVALTELEDLPQQTAAPNADAPASLHRVEVRTNQDLGQQPGKTSLDLVEERFALWRRQGFRIIVDAPTRGQSERLAHLLGERGIPTKASGEPEAGTILFRESSLSSGFRWPSEGWVFLTESELLGRERSGSRVRGRRKSASAAAAGASASADWAGLDALSDLSPGDTVVHIDHGVGRYQGLTRLELSGAPADFLLLEYANKDKLYLPVYRLNVIQKHGALGESAVLDKLGGQQFQKTKERVRESVRKMAVDLVTLYAERSIRTGHRFSARDAEFEEFEARFPHDETPDQARAIDAVLDDMVAGKIMDRLVCGDVGYGKTEVAIRAAYRAACDGKQVAVLVPTTLLAHQHEQSFRGRLEGLPVRVDSLSRFKSTREQKETLKALEEGKIDILIGTHRLLSKDVSFRDLGLLIVDEEHRFGVEHKEKIKSFKLNVPVITLTATPIPRTLHMALSGLREISLIRTPPVDRLPIRTFVSKQDDAIIKQAVEFELNRGGQVFYLYNRIQSIHEATSHLRSLCPHARIVVGHGQMAEGELESAIREFYDKKANVLVCTSIIESGIDLPSANTILIHRADTFGLAQLYQIRGRVGRGQQRGYAYLMIPAEQSVSEDAKKRLDVLQRFVELGSGFSVASHDLEIRGGGDLLGPQQSGNIQAVGFEMYLSLLEDAVQEIRAKPGTPPAESTSEPEIKAPFPAFLSDDYVPDVHQRLSLYRKLSACGSDEEVDSLEEELRDRFGPVPEDAQSLLWLIRVKVHLKRLGIDALTVGPERIVVVPGKSSVLDPSRAIALVSAHPAHYQLTPDSRFVARRSAKSMKDLYFLIQDLLRHLRPPQGVANARG